MLPALLGLLAVSPAAAQSPDDVTRLEPVVVTVTRTEQKAGDAPASVSVVTRDDIRHSASQTVVTARYVGEQYEDDLNTLPLGSYVVFDLFLARAIGKSAEVYVAVENLLDRVYTTGRTSEGVISTGEPRIARGGLRLRF